MPFSDIIGTTLGRYRILEQLGAGGMGVVYRARDERLQRDVAIKVLPPGLDQQSARRRLRQEAQALSKLNHPHIATIYDFDSHGDTDFVVMEYIKGATLADRLRADALSEKEALSLSQQIAEALDAAHEQGVLHRDLKPGNIMVTPKGQVKILDFGLATIFHADPQLAATQSANEPQSMDGAGTPPYMAPEQLRQEVVDQRTDIWAAGAVLYEMATGHRPFPQKVHALLTDAILNQPPPPPRELNPGISPALEGIILKALEKDPALRYQSAKEFLVDHLRLSQSVSATSSAFNPIVTPTATAVPRRRFNKLVLAGALLVAVIAAGLTANWLYRARKTSAGSVVLIGEFENRTNEPVFDRTLREMLGTSLGQSHTVSVFPANRVSDVLARMARPAGTPINEALGVEICQREGLQALVLGSISRLGDSYLMAVRAVEPNGETLVSSQAQIQKPDQAPPALDKMVQEVRAKLGELPAAMRNTSAPLAQVTSPSLEAVRLYTLGKERLYSSNLQEAVVLFQKAAEIDPQFAMAHEYLAAAYYQLNDPVRAVQHEYEASLLVSRVTESERLKILGDYNLMSGNCAIAIGYYQALAELRPRDPAPFINLGLCYADNLEFDAAIAATAKAVTLAPNSRVRINLAERTLEKGDPEKAWQIVQEVRHTLPDDVKALRAAGNILLMLGKLPEARQLLESMIQSGGIKEMMGRAGLADLDRAQGRYREARANLKAGVVAAEKQDNQYQAWKQRIELADIDSTGGLLTGDPPQHPVLLYLLGRFYANGRRTAEANKILRQLDALSKQRSATVFRSMLQAEIAVNERDTARAVEAAEEATRQLNSTMALETLGRALAAAGRDGDALHAYEQVLARGCERANSYDDPGFHHLAEIHYRAGVLYRKTGDDANARKHLQAFLDLAPQADAGLPTYAEARKMLLR